MASFDEVIPPGKAGTIKASVHTATYKGQIGKQVTVTHDDRSQGPIQLNVMANIVASVEILPYPSLQLMRHQKGFERPALLIVRKDDTETGTFKFASLSASQPWLKATSRTVTADEPAVDGLPAAKPGDVVLSVQAETSAPVGNHQETVKFKTGLSREPEVSVPVSVYVQAAVTLQPPSLILNPTGEKAETASGQVLAAVRDDVDAKSVTVKSDTDAFEVRLEPSGASAFRLFVDWKAKAKKPATSTTIHVKAGKELIDFPVSVAANPS